MKEMQNRAPLDVISMGQKQLCTST